MHTEYSPLDGLAKIEELITKAIAADQEFIAITDHGCSSGLYDAYKLGKKYNFPVLLGEEFYFENNGDTKKNGHLILMAKSEEGLANIYRLQEKAYRNFYYKPRLNLKMLQEHSEGLICTTACTANQINQMILIGENHLAVKHIKELEAIFGEDLYIELQSSTIDNVIKCNIELMAMCKAYGLKPILTNDVHYVDKQDYAVHEVLLAIQQQQKMDSPKRWKFEKNDYWLKSQDEMEAYLDYLDVKDIHWCYDNVYEIYTKCKNVEIASGNYLPKFCETKEKEDEFLADLTMEYVVSKLIPRGEQNSEFLADLQKELKVISETGYSGYYLIVQEYIDWAKKNGILVGDGRGSGAGSKVAYTIGITEVNPQKYDLLFERFLTQGRQPDFDVDFSDIDAVYKHLQERYGENNVARVGAFNRFTAKSALRKVMGIYGFSQSEISNVSSMLPSDLHFTLASAMERNRDFDKWMNSHPNILLAVSKLEGIMSHFSTHAGGVIICDDLTSKLPIMVDSKDKDKLVVALDKKIIENLGHYKFDILGLNSLTLMKDALQYTPKINWHEVDYEDENVYKMLCEGDVLGVFQLSDQQSKVIEQQPHCFEDLIAINALIRPGVGDWNEYIRRRKNNYQEDRGLDYLSSTKGIIVYQEQYLLLANTYAGWDIAYADNNVRKNKDIVNDGNLAMKFFEDSVERGFEPEDVYAVWKSICNVVSGGYGFNRSHATSYAVLAFQTAYMKHYYPDAFYAAYMSQNFDDTDVLQEVINHIKPKGIKILPPDINESNDKFVPTKNGIMFPITSIKGVGASVLNEVNKLKPIKSFDDFMERRIAKFIKRTAIEALVKAGAFDFTGQSRYETLKKLDYNIEEQKSYVYEKEALGLYLSDSPFDQFSTPLFADFANGDNVMTILEISKVDVRFDKNKNEMAFIIGVNKTDVIKMIVFSSVWKTNKCEEGQLVLVKGRKDNGSLLVNSIELLEQ